MQVKQSDPTGGVSTGIAAIPNVKADYPELNWLGPGPRQRGCVKSDLRPPCDGYTVPTPENSLNFGGMLSKIEQSLSICNCTLVQPVERSVG